MTLEPTWLICATASSISGGVFDVEGTEKQAEALEAQSQAPDFWDDPQAAQSVMRKIADLRETVDTWQTMRRNVDDALLLWEMAAEEDDAAMRDEVTAEAERLGQRMEELEFQLLLSGEYDRHNAILSIHAGAGGTEAQDWASMLLRMYLRWCERRRYKADIVEETPGEEAGILSARVEVVGPWAYGYLKAERGVHRLVRISPFDANKRRHTSFALVEVVPEIEDDVQVSINPDDIKMDVFRAQGAGGQNVQKNSTAVRITHIPSGIVVSVQNERSQLQNKEMALKILKGKLLDIELEKREQERARLKGVHKEAGWGNQIRSYVLQPYQMVKDLRTGCETSQTTAVLDGELDEFIEAYLKDQVGAEAAP